jgi:hypothetical protein
MLQPCFQHEKNYAETAQCPLVSVGHGGSTLTGGRIDVQVHTTSAGVSESSTSTLVGTLSHSSDVNPCVHLAWLWCPSMSTGRSLPGHLLRAQ